MFLSLASVLRRPSSRSQVLGVSNKELDGDTQIAKKQQSFAEGESRKTHSSRKGERNRL
jgi:hypothetical protein